MNSTDLSQAPETLSESAPPSTALPLPGHLPGDTPEDLRQDLETLWKHLKAERDPVAEEIMRRYPRGQLSDHQRALCLQYEFRRHLNLDLPPLPGNLWTPFTWPAGTLGQGLLSLLAGALSDGDGLSVHLRREGDSLRVLLKPHPYAGEPHGAAHSVTVQGTPMSLDQELHTHLPEFTRTRRTVAHAFRVHQHNTEVTLEEYAQAEALPDTGQGQLHLLFGSGIMNLSSCGVRLHSEAGQITTTADQFPMMLTPGKYTVHVQQAGFKPHSTAVTILPGKIKRLQVALRAELDAEV